MSFSTPTISHSFQSSEGTVATGVVEFSLLTPMTSGTVTLLPPAITSANLDGSGDISVVLTSNLDPGTEPAPPWQATYRVDIQVNGAQSQSYVITVPPIQTETNGSIVLGALDIVQLSSLKAAQYMVGQSIVCAGNIPTGATVVAVNTTNNTATMSTAGTAGTALSIVLGDSVDLGALLPTVPQPL